MEGLLIGLVAVVALATLNMKLVDWLAAPVRKRYPTADLWWLAYVAAITGAAMGMVAGVNLFPLLVETMPALEGRVLTSLLIGAGSNVIFDWLSSNGATPERRTAKWLIPLLDADELEAERAAGDEEEVCRGRWAE